MKVYIFLEKLMVVKKMFIIFTFEQKETNKDLRSSSITVLISCVMCRH